MPHIDDLKGDDVYSDDNKMYFYICHHCGQTWIANHDKTKFRMAGVDMDWNYVEGGTFGNEHFKFGKMNKNFIQEMTACPDCGSGWRCDASC